MITRYKMFPSKVFFKLGEKIFRPNKNISFLAVGSFGREHWQFWSLITIADTRSTTNMIYWVSTMLMALCYRKPGSNTIITPTFSNLSFPLFYTLRYL